MNKTQHSVGNNGESSQGRGDKPLWDVPTSESKDDYFERIARASHFENDGYVLALPILERDALHGILKDITRAACDETEAVPSSVAIHVLGRFAATIGRTAYIQIGDEVRYLNFDALIVGPTGRGRKGTSAEMPRQLFRRAEWLQGAAPVRELTALSTGEGLIHQVRDPRYGNEGELVDKGEGDKRLLCDISEFAGVLSVAKRETQTITMVLRDAFDGRPLTTPTKTSFNCATGAHIAVVGSVPETELAKFLSKTDMTNGLANRFGMFYSTRQQVVATPRGVPPEVMDHLARRIQAALNNAVNQRLIDMTPSAKDLWEAMYADLNDETHPPLIASLLARQDLYTRIFAALISLVNGKSIVDVEHLMAAQAWMRYWKDTVNFVFSSSESNENMKRMRVLMDNIVQAITTLGRVNVSHTDLTKRLTNNYSKSCPVKREHVKAALELLQRESPPRIVAEPVTTDGRPRNVYSLVGF
jgi:hypothetical protein